MKHCFYYNVKLKASLFHPAPFLPHFPLLPALHSERLFHYYMMSWNLSDILLKYSLLYMPFHSQYM